MPRATKTKAETEPEPDEVEETTEPEGDEQTASPATATEPEPPEAEEPEPQAPTAPQAPAPDLSTQIAAAVRIAHEDEAHKAEHERIGKLVTEPEPEKPKGFLDRLRWGG